MEQLQLIGIKPSDLVEQFDKIVEKRLEVLKKDFQPKEPTVYLTRQEVAALLSISLKTVHNWTAKGILKACRIGDRVLYKRSDIDNSMVELSK